MSSNIIMPQVSEIGVIQMRWVAQSKIEEYERKQKEDEERVGEYKERLKSLEAEKNQHIEDKKKLQDELIKYLDNLRETEREVKELRTQLEKKNEEIKELNLQIIDIKNQFAFLEKENEDFKKKSKNERNLIEALTEEIKKLKKENDELKEENRNLNDRVSKLEENIGVVQISKSDLILRKICHDYEDLVLRDFFHRDPPKDYNRLKTFYNSAGKKDNGRRKTHLQKYKLLDEERIEFFSGLCHTGNVSAHVLTKEDFDSLPEIINEFEDEDNKKFLNEMVNRLKQSKYKDFLSQIVVQTNQPTQISSTSSSISMKSSSSRGKTDDIADLGFTADQINEESSKSNEESFI